MLSISELQDYELKLVVLIQIFGKFASRKGLFIREHLKRVGSDYIMNIHRRYCDIIALSNVNIKTGTYASTIRYFKFLRDLDLIRLDKQEPRKIKTREKERRLYNRHYYKLNEEKIDSPDWYHPKKSLYGN